MEENKAKTTAAEVADAPWHVDGANADTVASAQTTADEGNVATSEEEGGAAGEEHPARGETEEAPLHADAEATAESKNTDVNRENARRRREAELERRIQTERAAAIIEALDGKNPYNGEAMQDADAVARFLDMKRERDAEVSSSPEVGSEEWYRLDRARFCERYPDVSLDDLILDPRFCSFSEGKVGHLPMEEIYAGYQRFLGAFDGKAKSLAAQAIANRMATPGELGGSGGAESDYYSPERVRRMTPAEVREHYPSIRRSMERW